MNTQLIPNANWQTQQRGTNDAEYQIYVTCAELLGWYVKSYDEWLGVDPITQYYDDRNNSGQASLTAHR